MTAWVRRHEVTLGLLVDVWAFLTAAGFVVWCRMAGYPGWAWFFYLLATTVLIDAALIMRTGRVLWYRKGASDGDDG